jgi:hypothetical protein
MSAQDNLETLRRYRSYGLWGGLFLGIVIGIVIGGPQFREWENPLSVWGTLIISCAAVGAIVGFFFLSFLAPGTGGGSHGVGGGSGTDSGGGDGGGGNGAGGD